MKQLPFAFPFRKKGQDTGAASADFTDEHEFHKLLSQEPSGTYSVSGKGMWHGGIHVTEAGAGASLDLKSGVRCIADGEVVAWRVNRTYPVSEIPAQNGNPAISAPYSTGFALVRHSMEFPKDQKLTFYSLYAHLQDFADYESDTSLPRPKYWTTRFEVTTHAQDRPTAGAGGQSAPADQQGLRVRVTKPHGTVLGILPHGAQVSVGKREGGWGKIKDASGVTPYPPVAGGFVQPSALVNGWIFLGVENGGPVAKEVMPDSSLDKVVVLSAPSEVVQIKAGELIGHLGRYDSLSQQTSGNRMVHIEVFCDDSVRSFIEKGSDWIKDNGAHLSAWQQLELPADPTILRIASQTMLYKQPNQEGADPRQAGVIEVFPLAALVKADADHQFMETAAGSDGQKRHWWKVDSADVRHQPIDGWVREQSFTGGRVTREFAQKWVDFQPLDDEHDPTHTMFATTQGFVDYSVGADVPNPGSLDKLSPLMTSIYQALHLAGDQTQAANDLRNAANDPWNALRMSRLIIQHESEWANPDKWKQLIAAIEAHTGPRPEHAEEQKRIEKLVWWDEVKASLTGFPASNVFHIHPIGLVGNFLDPETCACGCCMTVTGTRFKKDQLTYWYGPQHSGSIPLGDCPALATMRTNGALSETEERILRAMSKNEGKVDTVQAIDKAIISAGAMQKTIRGSASQGELATQVAAFRDAHPAEYQRYFANCGWTVTGSGSDASLGYAHAKFTNGVRIVGDELYTALRRDCSVHTFGQSVECPPVASMAHAVSSSLYQELQIKDFINRLNQAIDKVPSGYAYQIKDYFQSPLGRATVLDQDVNWPRATPVSVKTSLDRFFQHNPQVSRNPAEWGANRSAYETSIVQDYGPSRSMAQVNGVSVAPARYQHLVQALGMPS
ncbi:hypothetical protein [Paraburkholderia sp. MM5482-R1]|uniref:hypothetical protein n=1 Tax=Paraburkholderia sp. MM5482-R1 TaxID=2991063 RepID=UPI003D23F8D3